MADSKPRIYHGQVIGNRPQATAKRGQVAEKMVCGEIFLTGLSAGPQYRSLKESDDVSLRNTSPRRGQNNVRAILELVYPKADGAGIHCFKVLTIAGKTIIESAVGATPRVAPGEAPILRGTWGSRKSAKRTLLPQASA